MASHLFIQAKIVLRDDQTPEKRQIIEKDFCQRISIEERIHIKSAHMDLLVKNHSLCESQLQIKTFLFFRV